MAGSYLHHMAIARLTPCETAVATSAPAARRWQPPAGMKSCTMFNAQANATKQSGARISQSAQNTAHDIIPVNKRNAQRTNPQIGFRAAQGFGRCLTHSGNPAVGGYHENGQRRRNIGKQSDSRTYNMKRFMDFTPSKSFVACVPIPKEGWQSPPRNSG